MNNILVKILKSTPRFTFISFCVLDNKKELEQEIMKMIRTKQIRKEKSNHKKQLLSRRPTNVSGNSKTPPTLRMQRNVRTIRLPIKPKRVLKSSPSTV